MFFPIKSQQAVQLAATFSFVSRFIFVSRTLSAATYIVGAISMDKCSKCGAPIENGKCTYCGEIYKSGASGNPSDAERPCVTVINQVSNINISNGRAVRPYLRKTRVLRFCLPFFSASSACIILFQENRHGPYVSIHIEPFLYRLDSRHLQSRRGEFYRFERPSRQTEVFNP